jgi:hypothetical protein
MVAAFILPETKGNWQPTDTPDCGNVHPPLFQSDETRTVFSARMDVVAVAT